MYVYHAYLGDLRQMLIRNIYYLVQIIFVAAIAASIKAPGDKNVLTPIKLLGLGAHVISINQRKRMAHKQISTIFKKWDLLVTLEGKYV